MRWRLRIWRLKKNKKGKALEACPIDRDVHPVDEERFIYHPTEDVPRRLALEAAGPGDTFELKCAPRCVKCKMEAVGATEYDLQKRGWGGSGDDRICPACGGEPRPENYQPQREESTIVSQLCSICGKEPIARGLRTCHGCNTPEARREANVKALIVSTAERAESEARWKGLSNQDRSEPEGDRPPRVERDSSAIWGIETMERSAAVGSLKSVEDRMELVRLGRSNESLAELELARANLRARIRLLENAE